MILVLSYQALVSTLLVRIVWVRGGKLNPMALSLWLAALPLFSH